MSDRKNPRRPNHKSEIPPPRQLLALPSDAPWDLVESQFPDPPGNDASWIRLPIEFRERVSVAIEAAAEFNSRRLDELAEDREEMRQKRIKAIAA